MKIAYAQCTYYKDYPLTLEMVKRSHKYFDYIIIVVDQTINEEQVNELESISDNVIVKKTVFKDNIPEYRNQYLKVAKKLGVDWLVVSDPDEIFCDEFLKDVRKIVEEAEKRELNCLLINCREQFEAIEWLDDLDKLKESPGGYRESNYYKQLIFKIYPDLRYEGVGVVKTVHETWYSPTHPWKCAKLPKKYYYIHIKSPLKIWRNAARNVYLGGGGDNVGDLNPLWRPLLEISRKIGCDNWECFERFIESGNPLPPELVDWIKKALKSPPTDYGTENRETAKWIIWYHRELLKDPEIKELVKKKPSMTEESFVENYVRYWYFKILGRHPDRAGLEYYKEQIMTGKIRMEELPFFLLGSQEFREKAEEHLKIPIPLNIDVSITPNILELVLMRSGVWFEDIKPRLDIGKFILNQVKDPDSFIKWFYRNKEKISLKEFADKIKEESI